LIFATRLAQDNLTAPVRYGKRTGTPFHLLILTNTGHAMAIVDDEVRQIAHLARIEIDDNEIPGYAEQLSKILDFVTQMNAVDTDGIEPLAHPLEVAAHNRADVVLERDMRESFQSNAPQIENSLYLVPKVIE